VGLQVSCSLAFSRCDNDNLVLWCAVPQALCAEASLAALRRVYPQIYASDVKLLIDPSAVHVTQQDFISAMKGEQINGCVIGEACMLYRICLCSILRALPGWRQASIDTVKISLPAVR